MKLSDTAAAELPLDDERLPEPKKQNRHVVIALNHLRKRRGALEAQDKTIQEQLVEIDAAIAALE
jgi:hypothetical protein